MASTDFTVHPNNLMGRGLEPPPLLSLESSIVIVRYYFLSYGDGDQNQGFAHTHETSPLPLRNSPSPGF